MKTYRIYDEELKIEAGCLLYFEKSRSFVVELSETLDEWNCPLLFSAYVKNDVYTIPRNISYRWVKERIIPSDRQNIGSILAHHKLREYDELKILEISKGKSSQDSIVVFPESKLPDYVIERDKLNLAECSVCTDLSVLCFLKNGETRKTDLSALKQIECIDKLVRNRMLFETCSVVCGGRYITFDNSFDIPAKVLYSAGVEVPVSLEDFKLFIRNNLLDTSQSCEYLNCSRQNLAYMVRENEIHPERYNVRGNLYLKGELSGEGSFWVEDME